MGAYRFLLSIAVVVMHGGFTVFGFLSGIVAVYSFFILSGYLMTLLIQRHYADPSRIGLFYLDRAARIFPQFLFYLVATLIWISWAPPTNPLITGCNAWKVALNLMIVPMHVFDSVGIQDCMVIFPAWTLGLEFVFYAVIPFILLAPFRLRVGLAMVSIAVFLLSFVGAIDTTVWGYRYLPGTLFVFLAGCAIADPKTFGRHFALGIWLLAVMLFVIEHVHRPLLFFVYNQEYIVGLLIGIPAVALLSRIKLGEIDEFFGNLAYGVFLNHFLCLVIAQQIGIPTEGGRLAFALIASVLLSVVSFYLIERPALEWRRSLRSSTARTRQAISMVPPII